MYVERRQIFTWFVDLYRIKKVKREIICYDMFSLAIGLYNRF